MNLQSSIVATNGKSGADEFYWSNSNEYHNLSAAAAGVVKSFMDRTVAEFDKAKGGNGDITVTLTATVDGAAQPTLTYSGIDKKALTRVQRMLYKEGEAILRHREAHLK